MRLSPGGSRRLRVLALLDSRRTAPTQAGETLEFTARKRRWALARRAQRYGPGQLGHFHGPARRTFSLTHNSRLGLHLNLHAGTDNLMGRARGRRLAIPAAPASARIRPAAFRQGYLVRPNPSAFFRCSAALIKNGWSATPLPIAAPHVVHNYLILLYRITYPHVLKSLCVTPGPCPGLLTGVDSLLLPVTRYLVS